MATEGLNERATKEVEGRAMQIAINVRRKL